MLLRRYRLTSSSRLVAAEGRRGLYCSNPLQWISLNETAWALLGSLDGRLPIHDQVDGLDRATLSYLDNLAARGVLALDCTAQEPGSWPRVRVVVPVYGRADSLLPCLEALAAQDYPAGMMEVVVVDDGTIPPLSEQVALPGRRGREFRWLRLEANLGPGQARNAGAGLAAGRGEANVPAPERLAFVDSDCVPHPSWLSELMAVLDDPWVDLAGGGVAGMHRVGWLAQYEHFCASLNLGTQPGAVGGVDGSRAYLPACNMAVKAEAFRALGGFRPGWRMGEDVELSWRFHRAGYGLFYWPRAMVGHRYRVGWRGFLGRKRDYARTEGALIQAHPGRYGSRLRHWGFLAVVAPPCVALAGGAWSWAAGLAAVGAAWEVWRSVSPILAWPRGAPRPSAGEFGAALGRGMGGRWMQESRVLLRNTVVLWPPLLALWPILTPVAAGLAGLACAGEWLAKRPAMPRAAFAAAYVAECGAYSLGRLGGIAAASWRASADGAVDEEKLTEALTGVSPKRRGAWPRLRCGGE